MPNNNSSRVSRTEAAVIHYLLKRRQGRSISHIRRFVASHVNPDAKPRGISTLMSRLKSYGYVEVTYGEEDRWCAAQEGKEAVNAFLAPFSSKLHAPANRALT